ncbi:MAG: arginine--tRNA ligase [Nanobdellota archaeon]
MDYKDIISESIKEVIGDISKKDIKDNIEIPPDKNMGDFAFPCFILAKIKKKNPAEISEDIKNKIDITNVKCESKGPYLNFFIDNQKAVKSVLDKIDNNFGMCEGNKNVVLIESPGPNTNKPLHLGHLRNMLLGQSIFNLCKLNGKNPHMINIVNDRGMHICKSMLGYKKFGGEKTPESENRKPDHFVGDFYVKYSQYEEENPEAKTEVQELLKKWENNDPETISLWKKMNEWAYEGWKETYEKLDFRPEKSYYESETYKGGKDIIIDGYRKGLFDKDDEGKIIIDFEKEDKNKNLGKKVLLRADGTSIYITQDINTAKIRYDDFKFDEMIYVVGNEQQYHFKVLFEVFKKLGWSFGDKCYHFSYGMVELPEGKMKSREGTVVDTDDVLENMKELASEEVDKRYNDLDGKEKEKRAECIALSAIRFFFLKHDALKNFVFNPKESLSFEGETGPYVQYTYARIASIKRKAGIDFHNPDFSFLKEDDEKYIAMLLDDFPEIVNKAFKEMKPNYLCHYLIKLCQNFNSYYSRYKIISEDEKLMEARLYFIDKIQFVIKKGLDILKIETLEVM